LLERRRLTISPPAVAAFSDASEAAGFFTVAFPFAFALPLAFLFAFAVPCPLPPPLGALSQSAFRGQTKQKTLH
jgi:hypothetical protein